MPPTATSNTLLKITIVSRNERNAEYSRMKIRPSDRGMIHMQPAVGLLHLLEFAAPDRPVGDLEEVLGLCLGLVHGAAQVAAADAELDGDQPLALLAVDGRVRRRD